MSVTPAEITDVHERYLEITLDVECDLDETLTPIIQECGKQATLQAIERTCRQGKVTIWKDLRIAALRAKAASLAKPVPRYDQPAPRAADAFKAPPGWRAGLIEIIRSYARHNDTLRYCDDLENHHRKHGVLREEWLHGLNEVRTRARYNREHNIKPGPAVQELLLKGE